MLFPILYYLVSACLLTGILYVIWQDYRADNQPAPRNPAVLFGSLTFLLLLVMRLPSILYNQQLNEDESQVLTQAMTLWQDPVYGRSVDSGTIGPVNSYILLPFHALGLPFEYTLLRVTGMVLLIISLIFYYRSLQLLVSSRISRRLSFLVLTLFFASANHPDFLQYSSELTSLVLITGCFTLAMRVFRYGRPSISGLITLGFLAGLTAYCKLQSLPIVGTLLLVPAGYLLQTYRLSALRYGAALLAGFLMPTLLVFALAYRFGVADYFINYYFIGSLTTYSELYTALNGVQRGFGSNLLRFLSLQTQPPEFIFVVLVPCILTVAGALAGRRLSVRGPAGTWPLVLVIAPALMAGWAVIAPGTEFAHHLLLLVFPLGWLQAICLQAILNSPSIRLRKPQVVLFAGFLCLLAFTLNNSYVQVYGKSLVNYLRGKPVADVSQRLFNRNPAVFSFPDSLNVSRSAVAGIVRQYAVPGTDRLAVWGWNCRYYVQTQLAQGVSENHTPRSIIPNSMRQAYLNRYAADLLRNRPAVFLDAVGNTSLLLTKLSQRHENFALIHRIIRQYYVLAASANDVRIYVRQDRQLRLAAGHPMR
ncbi:hypothetical protein GCM10023187_25200 [Nibrella viscosa]|uniref:Dolichyl-phosphate-mannose-protein mannosyltransferase n=1 Tax=Nibrella viscosa TaxID=1084524 RepID=A0ABP8KGG1_9BACT